MDTKLKELIDKTAEWIAKQGPDMEKILLEREKSTPKFSFLLDEDENNLYYKQRIEYFKNVGDVEVKWHDKLIETAILSSTPYEVEIIKLAAQFIALNGESFNVSLQTKYNDGKFGFLEEEHHLNPFFQFLLKSYKVIQDRLNNNFQKNAEELDIEEEREIELDKITEKVRWNRIKLDGKNEKKNEPSIMASVVDWTNFIVVNTINFNEDEQSLMRLPPPTTLKELKSIPFLPPKPTSNISINNNLPVPTPNFAPPPQKISLPGSQPNQFIAQHPNPNQMNPNFNQRMVDDGMIEILEDYKPGSVTTNQQREDINKKVSAITTQICPRCGQSIPVHEMEEHMRIELMDTRYLEKKKQQDQMKLNITTDEDMSKNLLNFFNKRTQQEQNLVSSVDDDKKRKREEISWDPNRQSSTNTSNQGESLSGQIKSLYMREKNSQQLQQQQLQKNNPNNNVISNNNNTQNNNQNKNDNDEDEDDFERNVPKPFGVNAPSFLPNILTAVNLDPSNFVPPPESTQPKKVKIDSNFIPEQEFLEKNVNHEINLLVQVPKSDKKGKGKLDGQTLNIKINLTEKISALKEKISQETEIPVNKQKLKVGLNFLNDNNSSLAFYNLSEGNTLILSLKERGGRR